MSTVIIAIILLVVMVGGAAAFLIPAYLRQRIPWKQLPGTPVRYHSLAPLNEPALKQAYNDAFVLLRKCTDFTPETLARTASTLHIIVQRVNEWGSPAHEGKVAGIASGHVVYIGADFKALLHEVAHVCEYLEGVIDYDHRTWTKRGINMAQDAYHALLGAPP